MSLKLIGVQNLIAASVQGRAPVLSIAIAWVKRAAVDLYVRRKYVRVCRRRSVVVVVVKGAASRATQHTATYSPSTAPVAHPSAVTCLAFLTSWAVIFATAAPVSWDVMII